MKYALRLSYLGKNYCGWQRQSLEKENAPVLPSIQEKIEFAVSSMIDVKTNVVGSGRTDAGVNAVCQIAHFRCESEKYSVEIFKRGLNSLLPPDIRVMSVYAVPDDFHAQRSATKKQYSYYFQQGACPLPHLQDTTWWIHRDLDIAAMQTALNVLIGEHDFIAFQGRKAKPGTTTVRTILAGEVTRELMPVFPGQDLNERGFSVVRIRLVGTGFLKQMVRGIAGTLLQIGEKRRPVSDMQAIMTSLDRRKVGATAPSKGLTLEQVWYKIDLYGNNN
jgi:tRNA pseudouridine38-40 synthase